MKKHILFVSLALIAGLFSNAQTLVGTTPTPRNVVLEKFTGINCPQCPGGATAAANLAAAYPGRVNIVSMHPDYPGGSGYTKPQTTAHPDLRTATYAIQSMIQKTAFPTAMINRLTWTGAEQSAPYYPYGAPKLGVLAPGFQNAGAYVINSGGNSDVNIGVKTTFDNTTRKLTVDVELYYVAGQSANNNIHVALAQNDIVGYQSNGGSNYNHKHVLRTFLTGVYGEGIATPAQGQLITKQYVYTVPSSYVYGTSPGIPCDIDDCEIVVYVTDNTNKNTHTGITVKANNGQNTTTVGVEDNTKVGLTSLNVFPNPMTNNSVAQFQLNANSDVNVELFNLIGGKVTSHNFGHLNAGYHNLKLDFLNTIESKGIYLLKVNTNTGSSVVKVTL